MTRIQVGDLAALSAWSALAILSISAAAFCLLVKAILAAARRRRSAVPSRRDALLGAMEAQGWAGSGSACILFAIDDGGPGADRIVRLLREVARADDVIVSPARSRIAMIAGGIKREVDVAALVCRCQAAVEDQMSGASLSAGLALWRRGAPAEGVVREAERALAIALARGRGQMEMAESAAAPGCRIEAPESSPMLKVWIEPRIEAASGRVSAITPVPRWHHPALGLLDARDVLDPALSDESRANLLLRLLDDGLAALDRLEGAGQLVPVLSLPMTAEVARVSGIVARIAFSLDRAEIAAERLELRLSGAISPADLAGIGRIGCRIAAAPEIAAALPGTVGPAAPGILLDRASIRMECRGGYGAGRTVVALDIDDPAEAERLVALGTTHLQGPAIAETQRVCDLANWMADRTCTTKSRRAIRR